MRARDLSLQTSLYLALVLLCGGAGMGYPLLEGLEEVGAVALIAACFIRRDGRVAPLGRALVALWLFCLAVPAVQLVPLPPAIWTALPGRELAARIGELAGQGAAWRPISLLPERTVQGLLALLPPGALLLATLQLPLVGRWRLVGVVVGFGLAGVALGALQLATGGEGTTLFVTQHQGGAVGLFVNRNHQASFLLVAMVLAGALGARAARRWGWRARLPALAYAALLALGVIATTSRMGTLLLVPALLLTGLQLVPGRLFWRGCLLGALAAAAVMVAAAQSGIVQQTLSRFAQPGDDRPLFWQDARRAIAHSFPVGTGIGGFEPAHHAVEPLAHVGVFVPNHAHQEVFELVMDAGVAAILGLLALAVVIGAAGYRLAALPRGGDEYRLARAGLGGILLLLLHSLVDYPLRMTALAGLFALCAALAAPLPVAADRKPVSRSRKLAIAVGAMLVAIVCGSSAIGAYLMQRQNEPLARRLAPWMSSAPAQWATRAWLAGHRAAASDAARAALALSPVDASAVRTLALRNEAAGRTNTAAALMRAAGELGWRDRLTQYWLMENGFEQGNPAAAVARTDALLRQQVLVEPLFAMLHQAVRDPAVRQALAADLATRPGWGEAFLRDTARLDHDQVWAHELLLSAVVRRSPSFARAGIAATVARLAAWGDLDRAAALWATVTGPAPLREGGFATSSEPGGPFGWTLAQPFATRVAIEVPDEPIEGAALHVHSDGVASGIVAAQLVELPAGRSVLRFDRLVTPASAAASLQWRISCHGPASAMILAPAAPPRRGWVRQQVTVEVPRMGCRFQDLQLWSTATSPSDEWIDRVVVGSR